MKRAFAQRQIPTLVGLVVLVGALVVGTIFIGTGGGVFAPRATPQTTPKNLKITNVKDTSLTVSFFTDEATAGFVKYGKSATELKTQASDDRDQLSGSVEQYSSHYITLRDLDPETEYFFVAGTSSVPQFDNNGSPFSVRTAKRGGNPTAARTAYGTVNNSAGTPADGAVVYMNIPGAADLSSLVKVSGSWAIPLSNARTTDLSDYANFQPSDPVSIFVQGTHLSETATTQVTVAETQPVPTLVLSAEGGTTSTNQGVDSTGNTPQTSTQAAQASLTELAQASPTPSPSMTPSATPSASPTNQQVETVDTTTSDQQTVETSKPTFTGKAPPNTNVVIEIHSENELTTQVTTDANGNFVLPLSGGQTNLEPGQHTITIKYTDPTTGQQQTVTRTFFVQAPEGVGGDPTLLALANTTPSPTPFGTEHPFTIPSPSASASAQASASASPRVAIPSTSSGMPRSGSTGMTIALIVSGLFMIGVGIVSYRYNVSQVLIDSEDESP